MYFISLPPFCHRNRHRKRHRHRHRLMSDGHQRFDHSRFSKHLHLAHIQERQAGFELQVAKGAGRCKTRLKLKQKQPS